MQKNRTPTQPWSLWMKLVLSIPTIVATLSILIFLLLDRDIFWQILAWASRYNIWLEIIFGFQFIYLIVRVWQFDRVSNKLKWYWMVLFTFLYPPSSLFYIWSKDDELVELNLIAED